MTEKKSERPDEGAGAVDPAGEAAESEEPQAKTSYVFKIVPANPKNTFDFEDVADK